MSARTYEIVPGFFAQDAGYDGAYAILPHFGILDSSENRWSNTIKRLKKLNEDAPQGVAYKLLIAGRHGQGYHNLAELKYGSERWNEYWAKLDGDGEIIWGPDPLLTELGEDQARDAKAMWVEERSADVPLPDGLYCSPMTRVRSFLRYLIPNNNAREMYGVHSCDQRRSRSYLHTSFPEFEIEEGFSEDDGLYDPKVRETDQHVAERAHRVLDYIFDNDNGLVISITAHSGFIRGVVSTTKHILVDLPTGGVLPMVVKSTITI